MIPGVSAREGRRRAADFAHERRLDLAMTQAEVAVAAGVKDVKTIRNLETGRNWPSELTRRGIETALRVAIGTLDRIAAGETPAGFSDIIGQPMRAGAPTAQELIDLSAAIGRLSQAHEAMLRRGDRDTAEKVRTLIDAVSAVMGSYNSVPQKTAMRMERTDRPPTA
jgi:transcriptional regulator with XRE-family HTH domain